MTRRIVTAFQNIHTEHSTRRCVKSIRRCLFTSIWITLLLQPTAHGTTWRDVAKTCPIDGTIVKARVPASSYVPGVSSDFRPLDVGVDMYLEGMIRCPTCGFVAHPEQYDQKAGRDEKKIREALGQLKTSRLFHKYDAAIVVERSWLNRPVAIAHLTLGAKWLADETGEPRVIRERIDQAILAHQAVVMAPDPTAQDRPEIKYLIGELLRQQGQKAEAIVWFDRALPNADSQLKTMIQQQRFLAKHDGQISKAFVAKLKTSPAPEKLAAIGMLRESDDPEVLKFLEEFCLNGSDELREQAMHALVGREPRKQHLPIFLKAIGSSHFRTVQGGAIAVEQLRAKEAAPALVRALERPVQNTDYRLAAALAVVATEQEIPWLQRFAEKQVHPHSIFRALLTTGSSKAIPSLLRLLDKDKGLASFYGRPEDRPVLQAGAKIDGLLSQLPNLATADPNSHLGRFKIALLGESDGKDSADELAEALDRGGELALQAAIALVKRGDERGKPHFLERLNEVIRMSHNFYPLVLPFLKPADYDAIQRALQRDIDEQKQGIEFIKRMLAEADDPETKERERLRLEERLSRENWWMEPWLRMLGATGNPDTRPFLLKYLDDPNHQARAGAIDGLGYVYNAEVGDRLAARMKVEMDYRRGNLLRSFGRSGDRSRLPVILSVVEEPTLVMTKLAWIEAVKALNGLDQSKSVLETWTTSPNPDLAEAAKQSLMAK